MAGEYGACSELHKREIAANITFGKEKAVDIVIISDNKVWNIEVKTTNKSKFVTGFFQKFPTPETKPKPDFWVLVYISPNTLATDFYVLTHKEVAKEQMKLNKMTKWEKVNGVDNIPVSQLEQYKDKWDTIINVVKGGNV